MGFRSLLFKLRTRFLSVARVKAFSRFKPFVYRLFSFQNRSASRFAVEIFDYGTLAKPKRFYTSELFLPNALYGHARVIREYSEYNKNILACIEHGIYFGNHVSRTEIESHLQCIITFSHNREEYLVTRTRKKIIPIGPYIHYAKHYYSDERLKAIKESLGKVLLIFPVHSLSQTDADYDIDEFIKEINVNIDTYDTVLVCLYWADILKGYANKFENEGFCVITAGYNKDPYFISRLKSIISLADFIMTNSVGTHIGYCIYMKKGVYVYKQDIAVLEKVRNFFTRTNDEEASMYEEMEELEKVFSRIEPYITEEQYKICNKYWGFDCLKSSYELNRLLSDL